MADLEARLPTRSAHDARIARSRSVADLPVGARCRAMVSLRYGEAIVAIFIGRGAPLRHAISQPITIDFPIPLLRRPLANG